MQFWRLLILTIILLVTTLVADTLSIQAIEQRVYRISSNYQKAKARELMGAYKQAADAYMQTINDARDLIEQKGINKEYLYEVMPYTIASAYRLPIANEKYINSTMVYIYEQLEAYKKTDELISDTLMLISNLRIDHQWDIPAEYYSQLYYARAINSIAMSYALANGILWKKYLVYMPSDIIVIMDSANKDLKHYQFIEALPTSNMHAEKLIKDRMANNNLAKTISLSYYSEEPTAIAQALTSRQSTIQTYVARYDALKPLYETMSHLKTYEEFESEPQSRRFIAEMKAGLELLKKN